MSAKKGARATFWIPQTKIRDLLFTSGSPQNYRTTCPICDRPRRVRRTGFWPSPHPKIQRICGSRWAGRLASLLYTLPDFVILGSTKAGSSSLYSFISAHPHVVPASRKEVEYFSNPRNLMLGRLWYGRRFPSALYRYRLSKRSGFDVVSGEATPSYLFNTDVPGKMRRLLPDAKLIVIMRNPVDRAYSEYQMRIRERRESLSFEDAIKAEEKRVCREKENTDSDPEFLFHRRKYSYLGKGRYADHLANWFEHYDRNRFLILITEEMGADRQGVLDRVFGFLGLEPFRVAGLDDRNVWNYERMNPDTRRMLVDYFRPHNERLYKLLGPGYAFDWDR